MERLSVVAARQRNAHRFPRTRSIRCAGAGFAGGDSDDAAKRTSRAGESGSKARSEACWHSRSIGELEGENAWRDVYANYQQFDFVQVQGGKFKLPFSLDENTSPTNLDFVYRSLAARVLAPGRDRGVMVHGRVLDRMVRYELGIFDQDGRNARSQNPERVYGERTLAGRLVVQPFRIVEVDCRGPAGLAARSRRAIFREGTAKPARRDHLRRNVLRSRSLGAWPPSACRVRAAVETWTVLAQVRVHPRHHRAARTERRGHRPLAAARDRAGMSAARGRSPARTRRTA